MPATNIAQWTVVMAVTHVVGQEGLEGVQQLGGIWKIYLKAVKHRCELLSRKTLWIQSKMVALFDQNPYQNNLQSRDKLTIKGLPLHMKNDELKTMLESKGVVLCSPIKFSLIRDEAGQFTNYKNGDRFLYCEPLPQPIPRQQRVGDYNCYVHHHGKNMQCKSCSQMGHKAGDAACPGRAKEDSIFAFRGYEDPLSNHYPTPIQAFDQDFKSLEHAFFWKMATDLEKHELAARIKAAAHAGVAKRLSKEMAEEEREAWDHENVDVMRTLLQQKAKTCMQFRNRLLLNKDKILAESTINKRWGTGLPKFITEVTEPTLWPGTNLLGKLLMELTTQLTSSGMDIEYAVDEESDAEEGEVDESPVKSVRDTSSRDNNKTGEKKEKKKKFFFISSKKDSSSTAGTSSKKGNTSNKASPVTDKTKSTVGNNQLPDIREYLDPKTGKRKLLDSTPEKNANEKKQVPENH